MTKAEAIKMLTAKAECMTRDTSGMDEDCNSHNCGECNLCYEQGNMGEQIEYLHMAIKALEEPQWIPCSETADLPDSEVLCCDRYGEELIGWLLYSDDQWLCESDGATMYDPIAWREKPESQWIPCSITTNLPYHEVLCCDLRGEMLVGYLYVDESSDTGFGAESEGECLVDCVAWREKPEPWKEGDAE